MTAGTSHMDSARGRQSVEFDAHISAMRYYPGFLPGMRQPASAFQLELSGVCSPARQQRFDKLTRAIFGEKPTEGADLDPQVPIIADRILACALQVLESAGMPLFGRVPVRVVQRQGRLAYVLTLPAVDREAPAPRLALEWVLKLLNRHTNSTKAESGKLKEEYARLLAHLRAQAPGGINTLRFLQAADESGIPWRKVAHNIFQFGCGARVRWLDSSLTQEAPSMSVALARDKAATVSVLRQAGLPVPRHKNVNSEKAAVVAAAEFGYPVVVKAANLDGGRGVYVGLKSESAVRKAYADVSKLTRRILVEQYIEGNDYRLQVYKNEVFWVTHRKPAGVVGDGTSCVRALIDTVNREREAALAAKNSLLQPILVDEEIERWLADQGYDLDSVPAAGVFVRMRGAANISKGGTLEPVLERAHPDNIALAIRAARILRLDLAGVDLLIPDIAESWLKTGAAICEVNAQPQFSPHIPAWLMSRWFVDGGRIPVVATIGDPIGADWLDSLRAQLEGQGAVFAVARADRLEVAGHSLPNPAGDLCSAVQALLGDPVVDMLMIVVADPKDLRDGFPIDRLDTLVLHAQIPNQQEPGRYDAIAMQLAGISKVTLALQGQRLAVNGLKAKTRMLTKQQLVKQLSGMLKR